MSGWWVVVDPRTPAERDASEEKMAHLVASWEAGVRSMWFLTRDLVRSITVLVVVCPCALVLATPTAVAAAIGNAAKKGILVKSGAVMEQAGKIDVVAFDKTGTLTLGQPKVQDVIALNGLAADEILALAAAAERGSEHPIGRSITASELRHCRADKYSVFIEGLMHAHHVRSLVSELWSGGHQHVEQFDA